MTTPTQAVLRRHRAVTIGALLLLVMLAWAWMLVGAGMDMDGMEMAAPFGAERFLITFAMWWVMMVAMMLPSAAPTILLYARASAYGDRAVRPATESFLAGYLLVWGGFSLLASVLQFALEAAGLLNAMEMNSTSAILSAVLLMAAGIYQLTRLKQACLSHCQNPAQWLSRHYGPGQIGALRMGVLHGAYCVGCCWLLMALLFAGGVMNIAWIAVLTIMVAAEKLLPFGAILGRIAGVACLLWGAAILAGWLPAM